MSEEYEILNADEIRWGRLSYVDQEAIKGADEARAMDYMGKWSQWYTCRTAWKWDHNGKVYQGRNKKQKDYTPLLKMIGMCWHHSTDWGLITGFSSGSGLLADGMRPWCEDFMDDPEKALRGFIFHRNPEAPLEEWKAYEDLTRDDLPLTR